MDRYIEYFILKIQIKHEAKEGTSMYYHNIFKVPMDDGELRKEDLNRFYK